MRWLARTATTRRGRERGQGLVELAFLLPVLVLVLLAILDLGRGIYAYHVVGNCAREGARRARITDDNAEILAAVQNAAVALDLALLDLDVSYPSDTTVRVDVSYAFDLITPMIGQVIGSDPLLLHSAATMYTGY